MLRRAADERGAVLIFVATALPMFILFGIFVIDVGNWWVHKRHLQTQADAAALAGASRYQFPACNNDSIVREAVRYSGAQLWDTTPATYSINTTSAYNAQLGGSNPTKLWAGVNRPNPYNRNTNPPVDPELVDSPAPCETGFIDVKVTETDLPWFFGVGDDDVDQADAGDSILSDLNPFTDFIDARARVSLRNLSGLTNLLPIGVEDVNPKRVHAWFYDEDTQQVLGDAELYRSTSTGGLLYFDNKPGTHADSMPASFDVHSRRIGVKVALSGGDSITCGQPLVLCYGNPDVAGGNGVSRVHGFDPPTASGPVQLGGVYLIKGANCTATDNAYFSRACTTADIRVSLKAGGGNFAGDAALRRGVTARIQWNNNDRAVNLTWNGATQLWEGTGLPISDLGVGTRKIDIEWQQEAGTLTGITANCRTGSQNTCKGVFANAHKTFTGSRPVSGPLQQVTVGIDGTEDLNNVERCAAAASCPHGFTVRIALAGRIDLAQAGDPPISLRVFGSGSLNQSLDCDPNETQLDHEISGGCRPPYAINTGQTCPDNVPTLWQSPPPWRCVALQTGTNANGPAQGLNERILCIPANSVGNCTQYGRPQACTNWDRWAPTADPPWDPDDPRIMAVFIVPFGTFDSSGSGTVPVVDFAQFYIRGWTSNGQGWQNPCKNDPTHPDTFVPGTQNDSGVMSGNFVNVPVGTGEGTPGPDPCDTTDTTPCVAVMTK